MLKFRVTSTCMMFNATFNNISVISLRLYSFIHCLTSHDPPCMHCHGRVHIPKRLKVQINLPNFAILGRNICCELFSIYLTILHMHMIGSCILCMLWDCLGFVYVCMQNYSLMLFELFMYVLLCYFCFFFKY